MFDLSQFKTIADALSTKVIALQEKVTTHADVAHAPTIEGTSQDMINLKQSTLHEVWMEIEKIVAEIATLYRLIAHTEATPPVVLPDEPVDTQNDEPPVTNSDPEEVSDITI